jgi:SagB-type dehydrogenase family enzyme
LNVTARVGTAELHRLSAYYRSDAPDHPGLVRDWPGSMRAPKPPQFKSYPRAETIALPIDLAPSGASVDAALRSLAFGGDAPPGAPLDANGIARMLFYSGGVTRYIEGDSKGKGRYFRASGSSHNTSPLEIYLVCADLPAVAAGVYHYASLEHALHVVRRGDHRRRVADALAEDEVPAAYVVVSGVPWRSAWKYAERSFRNTYQDGGTLLAQLLVVCAASAATRAALRLGFVDQEMVELLALDGTDEFPLAVVHIGPPLGPPPARIGFGPAAVGELGERIAFPLVTEAQRSSDLATPHEVRAWRAAPAGRTGLVVRDAPVPTVSLERAILRRGSTRRFTHRSVDESIVSWAVPNSTRALPADFITPGSTLARHLVVVHDVENVRPGAYHAVSDVMESQRTGDLRAIARELSIDQALASDAALVAYHCGSVAEATAARGERGYRALALEVGTASGRLQLAASALGLGASGLVFYENELSRAFGATVDGHLATAVGVPAYKSHPGGPPGRPARIARIPTK